MPERYNPTGITAMARQHPMLERTPEDLDHLAKAKARQEARAAKRASLGAEAIKVLDGTDHPWPQFSRAEQRRLEARARKALK